ncbi:Crotonase superfamily [Propionibacterium ruminifibrarum]|uniref:Crotonase superfamily n=1 Tax=Propionibacterium ruminifibrarum TaxID=1962131 RepID=A0A375I150_9ACTN|nr:enoyl-CoA hydratase/isomerase family protein [Propionibacterium ruminifibrarum]SPF68543.1 Crotonase superfamily [Propionibacterium ruminifibrarum]
MGLESEFTTLDLVVVGDIATVTLDRPEHRNSFNFTLLSEVHRALDLIEADGRMRALVLRGNESHFCTGMDFQAYSLAGSNAAGGERGTREYMKLLRRLSMFPKIVVSAVEGLTLAGGVGLVAASDLVVASTRASFGLPEVMWGLLPSMVLPHLIWKVGHQSARRMTMLGGTISAQEAAGMGLVDQCVTPERIDSALSSLMIRVRRIHPPVVGVMKEYFRTLSGITDKVEEAAVSMTFELASREDVRQNIDGYLRSGRLPWLAN